MILWRWLCNLERAAFAIEFRAGTFGDATPFDLFLRHEARTVDSITIMETIRSDHRIALGEALGKVHAGERIAIRRAMERDFKNTLLLNRAHFGITRALARKDQPEQQLEY